MAEGKSPSPVPAIEDGRLASTVVRLDVGFETPARREELIRAIFQTGEDIAVESEAAVGATAIAA